MTWKLVGKVSQDEVTFHRKPRTSKYDTVVQAIAQAKPGEMIVLDLDGEEDPQSAAQRIAVAVRKCAEGHIEGKIRSRFDAAKKKIFLWEQDEAAAKPPKAKKLEGAEAANGTSKKTGRKPKSETNATA
jgi:hypothetical protein